MNRTKVFFLRGNFERITMQSWLVFRSILKLFFNKGFNRPRQIKNYREKISCHLFNGHCLSFESLSTKHLFLEHCQDCIDGIL